jgi:hypothetical protein
VEEGSGSAQQANERYMTEGGRRVPDITERGLSAYCAASLYRQAEAGGSNAHKRVVNGSA